jgi:tight adherence protein B
VNALDHIVAIVGGVAVAAMVGTGVLAARSWSVEQILVRRLARYFKAYGSHAPRPGLVERLEQALQRTTLGRRVIQDISHAGLSVKPTEAIVYVTAVALVVGAIATTISGHTLLGAAAGCAILMVGYVLVQWRMGKQLHRLKYQLPDALHAVASALTAGASLDQSLRHAAAEMMPPIKAELNRVVEDVEVGKTLEEALVALRDRVPLSEFDTVIASLLIQKRSGGNLSALLNETADLLLEDQRLQHEMEVLTAQARASAQLIGILPIGLFLYLYFFNPRYLEPMLSHSIGVAALAVGVVLELLGFFLVYRIASFRGYPDGD